jgi:hypothetical protein
VVAGRAGQGQTFAMLWTPETGMVAVRDLLDIKVVIAHNSWSQFPVTTYVSPDGG